MVTALVTDGEREVKVCVRVIDFRRLSRLIKAAVTLLDISEMFDKVARWAGVVQVPFLLEEKPRGFDVVGLRSVSHVFPLLWFGEALSPCPDEV